MKKSDRDVVSIGFSATDEFNGHFEMMTEKPESDLTLKFIGDNLNIFLDQVGFHRVNSNILMEDLSDDELDYLFQCLIEYRGRQVN